jgi:hypothetical protein
VTEEEEWKQREEDARSRFLVPTYTIKDQYSSPDAPFFVASYYINGKRTGGIAIERPSELEQVEWTVEVSE